MFRRRPALVAILAAGMVAAIAGCSAGGAAPAATAAVVQPTPTHAPSPTPTPAPTPSPTPAGLAQSSESCKAVLQPQIDILAQISNRLMSTEGIIVKDYAALVNALPLSDMDRLPGGANRFCRNVAVQDAASAELDHIEALHSWNNCLALPTVMVQPCIDKVVQRWWSKASGDFGRLSADMANLAVANVPPVDPDPDLDKASPKPTYTPAEVANMGCDRAYDDVISDLYGLGRSLAEGISLKDYGDKVVVANTHVQAVDKSGLDSTCLISIGVVANAVLGDHVDAWTAWQACGKAKTKAKYDACFAKNVNALWNGRMTENYVLLFDGLGTLYLDQVAAMPLF